MEIIAVDDEQIALDSLALKIERLEDSSLRTVYFTDASEALEHVKANHIDLAFLDINMRGITGLDLAVMIQKAKPDCLISFLTGYGEFALDAFKLHAFDYLMKPVRMDDLRKTIADAKSTLSERGVTGTTISARTFGQFDVFVNDKIVPIPHRRSKELLAYLIDRRGGSVTPKEGCLLFWPDKLFDRPKQSQYQVIVRNLAASLDKAGIGHILIRERGSLAVDVSAFECDLYRFIDGDEDAVNSFMGEYLTAYSWAEDTLGQLLTR